MKKQSSNTVTPRKKDTPTTLIGRNGSVVNTDGTGRVLSTVTPAKNQEKKKDTEPAKKKRRKNNTEIVKSTKSSKSAICSIQQNEQDEEQEKDITEKDQEKDGTERETDNTTIAKQAKTTTENEIQSQEEIQEEQELDQDLNHNDIVEFMEKDLYTDVGDYDIDNTDGNPTLLSVAGETLSAAEETLSDVSDREEDIRSHHDKRQSNQEDELPENRNRNGLEDESTNRSSSNDGHELEDKDDQEFGEFDYLKEDDSIHKIVDDKQEDDEIEDYYLEEESITNTKTE